MKILHVVPSYKPAYIYGGPIVVIAQLAETMVSYGHEVTVYTTNANGSNDLNVLTNEPVDVDGVAVYYFNRITKDPTQVSFKLWRFLDKTVNDFDVVHIHSWWNFLVIGAAWICAKHNVKPVLSPHGMFSDYILRTRNAYVKKIIHNFIAKRLLKKTFLHVSTDMEWEESQNVILDWKGQIIANMVNLSNEIYVRKENDVFTIGFLSRIDPKKGVDVLIKALSKVTFNYKLLVAGSGEEAYLQYLKAFSEKYGNRDKIEWVGWKDNETKFKFLSSLDLLALTSYSENFAVVVIEALSVGTPVLLSNNVGLCEYVKSRDYGWTTNMTSEQIADRLTEVYKNRMNLVHINNFAPGTIKEEFNVQSILNQYVQFYNEVYITNNLNSQALLEY
ncbi:XrtY-associated glycosyltransferase XYAG1 [Spirosoma sp. KUDC1026]|uniref:XrtY-associated glycosyltransferase XYAG1 n=1 Tax=Spirosoma sp. KUDC1026 TaxID=2745947 RepID=UPI00159BC005|nr:glycosyltransferase [Spirosoma sp. KUDC1026]QKZ15431.1 glycosyltransferase [Spirosoma sp. KUDC1026]